jgi:hypothetical protein
LFKNHKNNKKDLHSFKKSNSEKGKNPEIMSKSKPNERFSIPS